jgi:hypothetical protein
MANRKSPVVADLTDTAAPATEEQASADDQAAVEDEAAEDGPAEDEPAAADAAPAAVDGPPAGTIEVRVLSAHLDHKSDDVIWLSPAEAKAAKNAGWADPDLAAVAYARSLAVSVD